MGEKGSERRPIVEIGGEIDKGLEAAKGFKEVGLVDGEGIGGGYTAPVGCLLLKRLHR